jgi:hypothetical protein
MTSFIHIAPGDSGTGTGAGGGGEGPGAAQVLLRSQGLLTVAFGIGLGVACIALFFMLKYWAPTQLQSFVETNMTWRSAFLSGLITGTVSSAIYNLLVVRRLNLFGIDARLD